MKNTGGYKLIFFFYGLISLALFLYSYTQVDLNLTLSRVSFWQTIQRMFQYIGYYQRPVSTVIYIGIITTLFVLYGAIIALAKKGLFTQKQVWGIVAVVTSMLVFSYPAFSHDMFNYLFTAKTILVYHKNPYVVIPMQFGDVEPWLTFMRWIHLPSAYTPIWILLTLTPYLLGFGYFLLIMWNTKILVALFYLAAVWYTEKILEIVDKPQRIVGLAVFALNPLIIIESLVSAHNDIAMMTLALGAMYLGLKGKRLASWVMLCFSAAMKLMTVFLVPAYMLKWRRWLALVGMIIGLIMVVTQREFLPWYFVWIVPFIALFPRSTTILVGATGLSFGLLLRYAPFLYFGHWNQPVPTIIFWLTILPVTVFLASYYLLRLMQQKLRL